MSLMIGKPYLVEGVYPELYFERWEPGRRRAWMSLPHGGEGRWVFPHEIEGPAW